MTSPFLQIPDVPANTSNPWTPTNAAIALLDRAGNGTTSKVISGSTVFSTTETRENTLVVLTGTPGAPFTIGMPDVNARRLFVLNLTDADATIENSASAVGSGDTILIPTLEGAEFHYDGTDFRLLAGAGGGSGAVAVQDEGAEVLAEAATLNFVGDGVIVSSPTEGVARVSIPGLQVASPGPMKFLGEYDLTGANVDITDFGDRGAIEVVMYVVGAAIDTDGANVAMRFNAGGVVTTGYEGGGERNSGASVANFGGTTAMLLGQTDASQGLGNAAGEDLNAQVILHAPFVAGRKDINFQSSWGRALGGLRNAGYGGAGNSSVTTALDGIRFLPTTGNFTAGKVYVFGVYAENPALVMVGAPGPMKFVRSYDLAGLASQEVDLANLPSGTVSVLLRTRHATVSLDGAFPVCRVKKNGTVRSDATYWTASDAVVTNDSENLSGTKVNTSLPLSLGEVNFGVGNAANEFLNADLMIDRPDVAQVHTIKLENDFSAEGGGTTQLVAVRAVGRYMGADLAAVLEAVEISVTTGTFVAGTIELYALLNKNPVIAPGGTPGPIVQHVHSRDDVKRTTASATFVTATAAVTITPRSTGHRVRIRVSTPMANDNVNGAGYMTLFRNGVTDLTPAGRDGMAVFANSANLPVQQYFEFVDSPATTSPVTYNLFFKTNGQGTVGIAGRPTDANFDAYTMMVAEEILGDGELAVSPYIVTSPYLAGAPSASQVVLSHRFTRDVDFPVDFAGSQFTADVAATAATVFDVQLNGVSVGTATFAIAATTPTWDIDPAISPVSGDLLRVIAPATPDATLAGMDITLAGTTTAVD